MKYFFSWNHWITLRLQLRFKQIYNFLCQNAVLDHLFQSKIYFVSAEYAEAEAFLDEHPDFFQSYLIRKATRAMIDAWLVSYAIPQVSSLPNYTDGVARQLDNSAPRYCFEWQKKYIYTEIQAILYALQHSYSLKDTKFILSLFSYPWSELQ